MLKVQERAVELLKEIDEICESEGIKYSLAGRTAAMQAAAEGFTCADYRPEIMMLPADYRNFCKAVTARNNQNRSIESLETNPLVDGIYARYVDTSTTLIDFTRGFMFKEQGVYVLIWILRSKRPSSRYDKALESIVKSNRFVSTKIKGNYRSGKSKTKFTVLGAARPLLRRPGTMKKYFGKAISDDGKSKSLYYLGAAEKGREIRVPRKSMDNLRRVSFEGIDVMTLDKTEDMLKKNYDVRQLKAIYEPYCRQSEWGVYYDLRHPFSQVLRKAESDGTDFARLAETVADYNEFFATDFKKWDRQTNKDYWNVNRTIDRFALLEEYKGREDEIAAMYEAGRIDETREALAGYIEKIELYVRRKMGFCIDSRLLEIAYAIMELDGKEDTVKEAKKLMPKEFKEDLADWLAAEGYDKEGGK